MKFTNKLFFPVLILILAIGVLAGNLISHFAAIKYKKPLTAEKI